VDDLLAFILPFEMRDLERFDRLERQIQGAVRRPALSGPQILSYLPERAQYARPIESLSLAHRLLAAVKYPFSH
jgi:hypothetical protein